MMTRNQAQIYQGMMSDADELAETLTADKEKLDALKMVAEQFVDNISDYDTKLYIETTIHDLGFMSDQLQKYISEAHDDVRYAADKLGI